MVKTILVSLPDLREGSYVIVRNAQCEIGGLEVSTLRGDSVHFDCISKKREVRINAGMKIGFDDMTRLARQWLKSVEKIEAVSKETSRD